MEKRTLFRLTPMLLTSLFVPEDQINPMVQMAGDEFRF